MKKRGQVTVFVIIGIVILAAVVLFLAVRNKVYIGPANVENLQKEFIDFEVEIQNCLDDYGVELITQIGLHGGYLSPSKDTFRLYNDNKVSYLCYNQDKKPTCMNRMLTKTYMEKELVDKFKERMTQGCLDLKGFQKLGLDYKFGKLDVEVDIGDDSVVVFVNMPIEISKGDVKATADKFKTNVNLPLGRLYDASRDILNAETSTGYFDTSLYSVQKTGVTSKPYVLKKLQPYPDKLYILKIKDVPRVDDEFVFQFFVQGEKL